MKIQKIGSDSSAQLTAMVFIIGNVGWALKFTENGSVKMVDCNAPEIVAFLNRYSNAEDVSGEETN
jgi:hypothetical protein